MKRKYGLLKVLLILLFVIIVASYFIKGRNGSIQYVAFADVFFNYVQSFYYFFDTALLILTIGGFYGLLNRIPAYKQLIYSIADKFRKKNQAFLIGTAIAFGLISSLTGLNIMMLIFVPFMVSILLLIGYDKLVALSVTIGASIVGFMGGIFVSVKGTASQYGVSFTNFAKLVGLKSNWNVSTIVPICILLVIGIILLIVHVNMYLKDSGKEKRISLTRNDPLFIEVKDVDGKKIRSISRKVNTIPFIIIMVLMVVLLILGYMPWNDLFKIDVFNNFHTWLTKLSIDKYQVFTSLISSNISAFGTWSGIEFGGFTMAIFLMYLFGFVLTIVYRVKFEDAIDGFIYGAKKMISTVLLVMLAYSILVTSFNNGFILTIISDVTKKFGDNVVANSLITILGSILNVDVFYFSTGVVSNVVTNLTSKANLSIYAVMFQSLYGLVQLVGPTSIMLIVGLSYLDVSYKTWLKYIWRFLVELLIAIFVVLMIVSLL